MEMALTVQQKQFTIPKPYQVVKGEKYETFLGAKMGLWQLAHGSASVTS